MNHNKFLRSFDQMVAKTTASMAANVVLSAAVLLLVFDKVTDQPIVRLVPPTLTSEATIAVNSADSDYLMSWGLYFAAMTGNVTPRNATFVADAISSIVDPRIYTELRRQLFALAQDPTFKERGGSITFEPDDVSYDAPSRKVFIIGDQVSKTTSGEQNRTRYVYELEMEVRNGRPLVTAVDHYQGAARTAKWMKAQDARANRAERANPEDLTGVAPWFDETVRYSEPADSLQAGKEE